MKRFLLVGCGGSGGSVLQFLMDQLRADLVQLGLGDGLPGGWQFVHVDVPSSPDGVREGMPPSVRDQGGRYVPLSYAGAQYPAIARLVESRLADAGELREFATFRPYPDDITFNIENGAGQMRAVGRTLTVNQARAVYEPLQASFSALQGETEREQLRRVARVVSPSTVEQVEDPPVVLIVSSMAGGAGASMVLDVCRILTQIGDYTPSAAGLFLFTPEAFSSLPASARRGVDGNGMAMMGELLAAQSGAGAEGDNVVLRAMGLSGVPQPGAPFARVFPIGNKVGTSGAQFGDGSLDGVYRGLGRGLSALMLSGSATQEYVGYDLANPLPAPTKTDQFGWGTAERDWQWGSFGFASLAMGRERYAEYAAQRLARLVTDHLVSGHVQQQQKDPRSENDQLTAVVDAAWTSFLTRSGLPAGDVEEWLQGKVSRPLGQRLEAAVQDTVDGTLAPGHGADLAQWLPTALAQVRTLRGALQQRTEQAAYSWAFAWHRQLCADLEASLLQTVEASGLAAGRELLLRASASAPHWVAELRAVSGNVPPDVTAEPSDARSLLPGKGKVRVGPEVIERLRQAFRAQIWQGMFGRAAAEAADVLQSAARDLLPPLASACDEALEVLLRARGAIATDTGVARVETDAYTAWPADEPEVPGRFKQAHNEVLLTSAAEFPTLFQRHVEATFEGVPPDVALNRVRSHVVTGHWQTAGIRVEENVLLPLATWRPGSLGRDPATPDAVPSPMVRAAYRFDLRPDQLRARARRWVDTEGQPFDRFIRQSLRGYLTDPSTDEATRARRAEDVRAKFGQVRAMAHPLVGVNARIVEAQHPGERALVRLKFSTAPFGGLPLSDALGRDLEQDEDVEATSLGRFRGALTGDSPVRRFDVFGSYTPLTPAAFSSLLAPIARHWSSCTDDASRRLFFANRRSRRLPGGLPMGDAMRRALVGGWYVARLTGRLRLPSEHYGRGVEVYDETTHDWVAFPLPAIMDEGQYVAPVDVLPVTLLSVLLALAESHQSPTLDPFRPFTVLRRTWDDGISPLHVAQPLTSLAAARVLRAALTSDSRVEGAPPRSQKEAQAWPTQTPAQRRDALLEIVTGLRAKQAARYLPPGPGNPGGGEFSVIDHPDKLPYVPFVHELAPDIVHVLTVLARLLPALNLPHAPVDPNNPPIPKDPEDVGLY